MSTVSSVSQTSKNSGSEQTQPSQEKLSQVKAIMAEEILRRRALRSQNPNPPPFGSEPTLTICFEKGSPYSRQEFLVQKPAPLISQQTEI